MNEQVRIEVFHGDENTHATFQAQEWVNDRLSENWFLFSIIVDPSGMVVAIMVTEHAVSNGYTINNG